jgi:hypothetical protein
MQNNMSLNAASPPPSTLINFYFSIGGDSPEKSINPIRIIAAECKASNRAPFDRLRMTA